MMYLCYLAIQAIVLKVVVVHDVSMLPCYPGYCVKSCGST